MTQLPPYLAMLVVDAKDFSGNKSVHHAELSESIPDILKNTFQRAGHGYLWNEAKFPDSTGDGFAIGLRAEVLPLLVDPFLAALQSELEFHDKLMPAYGRGSRMRMRVSLSVGPLTDSGTNRIGDGKGDTRIETHRILDAHAVRHLLESSNPDVTFVAAILSARVYEDVVTGGYTSLHESLFVPAPVQVKTYQGTAYLHVPRPSGGLLTHGFRVPEPKTASVVPNPLPAAIGQVNSGDGLQSNAPAELNINNSEIGSLGWKKRGRRR